MVKTKVGLNYFVVCITGCCLIHFYALVEIMTMILKRRSKFIKFIQAFCRFQSRHDGKKCSDDTHLSIFTPLHKILSSLSMFSHYFTNIDFEIGSMKHKILKNKMKSLIFNFKYI